MALNPFFLQGTSNEQFLIQDLINEHLKIYGVDVYYLPRQVVNTETILREITASEFSDNYLIEAYVNNFEGYGKNSDVLTKFGLKSTNELSLTLSKERFDSFIGEFLEAFDDSEIILDQRPREGDLIFFPLGQRLFEVKHVEFENPFYQLGQNYIYELSCELFEYEDEVFDTTVEEIQQAMDDVGYITRLVLSGIGETAGASAAASPNVTGQIRKILVTNDGTGYTEPPSIVVEAPETGSTAVAVGIITQKGGNYSLKEILLKSTGNGYTSPPQITITGGGTGASGAAATAVLSDTSISAVTLGVSSLGSGYYGDAPAVTVGGPNTAYSGFTTAVLVAIKNPLTSGIGSIYIRDAGIGYTVGSAATIVIGDPSIISGVGTFITDEEVTGATSGTTARVRSWDTDDNVLRIVVNSGSFYPGEIITGAASSARYAVESYSTDNVEESGTGADVFQNDDIETIADTILDFSESNPFGEY